MFTYQTQLSFIVSNSHRYYCYHFFSAGQVYFPLPFFFLFCNKWNNNAALSWVVFICWPANQFFSLYVTPNYCTIQVYAISNVEVIITIAWNLFQLIRNNPILICLIITYVFDCWSSSILSHLYVNTSNIIFTICWYFSL